MGVEGLVPDCLVGSTTQRWQCGERRKTARWKQWCWHEFLACSWYETLVVMVELKLLEFFKFRVCQPSIHLVGYGQQVAYWDAEALNGALLVRGDDGSEEIKFRKDRYLTTVEIEGRGTP